MARGRSHSLEVRAFSHHVHMYHVLLFRVLTIKHYRAAVVNAHVARGHTVLITGIGGGVALLALKLCLALGARVYVTSGSDAKISRAIALGAAGGVNYTHSELRVFSPVAFFYFFICVAIQLQRHFLSRQRTGLRH